VQTRIRLTSLRDVSMTHLAFAGSCAYFRRQFFAPISSVVFVGVERERTWVSPAGNAVNGNRCDSSVDSVVAAHGGSLTGNTSPSL
jgi:hypothetical protein